jgi:hypothetical protein
MTKYSLHGLLFFQGRALRVVGYDVTRTHARVHADRLGLLPLHFYVAFDGFGTVAKCRLVWRWRDDIVVAFERSLDIRQRTPCPTVAGSRASLDP